MDLEIGANLKKTVEILKDIGFENITIDNGILEAKLRDGLGRFHVLGTMINNVTYLDVHRDSLIHIAFIGVDYSKKPKIICMKILDKATKMQISGKIIGGESWFKRKNKAIFKGVKI